MLDIFRPTFRKFCALFECADFVLREVKHSKNRSKYQILKFKLLVKIGSWPKIKNVQKKFKSVKSENFDAVF